MMKRTLMILALMMVPSIAQAQDSHPFGKAIGRNVKQVELSQHPFSNKNPFTTNMPATRAQKALSINQNRAANAVQLNGDKNSFNARQNWKAPAQAKLKSNPTIPQQNIGNNWQQGSQAAARSFGGNN